MEYCIVELADPATDPKHGTEVQRFESAYRAMEVLQQSARRPDGRSRHWYLIDGRGRILMRPDDFSHEAA
jgi:hypothetical protein